jgi:hypothetical protein
MVRGTSNIPHNSKVWELLNTYKTYYKVGVYYLSSFLFEEKLWTKIWCPSYELVKISLSALWQTSSRRNKYQKSTWVSKGWQLAVFLSLWLGTLAESVSVSTCSNIVLHWPVSILLCCSHWILCSHCHMISKYVLPTARFLVSSPHTVFCFCFFNFVMLIPIFNRFTYIWALVKNLVRSTNPWIQLQIQSSDSKFSNSDHKN